MKGKLIAIEGIDGSGKETQTKLLYQYIRSKNKNLIKYISFPNYNSPSSEVIKMYLNGSLSDNPVRLNPYAVSSFFAVDRFVSYVRDWENDYNEGALILANRYTSSNVSYQMAKVPEGEWDGYLKWIYDYEYNKLGLPRPDVTVYLDISVEVSQKLMNKRYLGDHSKKDLHESNINFLSLCVKASRYVAERDNWMVIDCLENGNLKNIRQINENIISQLRVNKILKNIVEL